MGQYSDLTETRERVIDLVPEALKWVIEATDLGDWFDDSGTIRLSRHGIIFTYDAENHSVQVIEYDGTTFDGETITGEGLAGFSESLSQLAADAGAVDAVDEAVEAINGFRDARAVFFEAAPIRDVCRAAIRGDRASVGVALGIDGMLRDTEAGDFVDAADEIVFSEPNLAVVVSTETRRRESELHDELEEFLNGRDRPPGDNGVFFDGNDFEDVPQFEVRRQIRDHARETFTEEVDRWTDAFVVGEDDTHAGRFVHEIDPDDLPDGEGIERGDVYEAMGFDRQYADLDDGFESMNVGDRIRVQGDLAIERLSGESRMRMFKNETVEEARRELAVEGAEERLHLNNDLSGMSVSVGLDDSSPSVSVEAESVEALESFLGVDLSITETEYGPLESVSGISSGKADALRGAGYTSIPELVLAEQAELADIPGIGNALAARIKADLGGLASGTPVAEQVEALRTLVKGELEAMVDRFGDEIDPSEEAVRKRSSDDLHPGQTNLPLDNHLVITGDTEVVGGRENEPVEVIAPTGTTLHSLHDEHDQFDGQLPPGRYRLYLLPRGGTNEFGRINRLEMGSAGTRGIQFERAISREFFGGFDLRNLLGDDEPINQFHERGGED